jgi:hypothetical protein
MYTRTRNKTNKIKTNVSFMDVLLDEFSFNSNRYKLGKKSMQIKTNLSKSNFSNSKD